MTICTFFHVVGPGWHPFPQTPGPIQGQGINKASVAVPLCGAGAGQSLGLLIPESLGLVEVQTKRWVGCSLWV